MKWTKPEEYENLTKMTEHEQWTSLKVYFTILCVFGLYTVKFVLFNLFSILKNKLK